MPYKAVNGVDIHYLEAGTGSSILLLGGTLSAAEADFRPQLEGLSASHRCVAPDRSGYGKTRPPERTFPDDFYQRDAREMAAFIEAMGFAPTAVLGWSEGADVALSLAALFPQLISKLVVWGGISCVASEDLAIFESRRDIGAWHPKAKLAMTEIYGDGYWQRTWFGWCDVMARLHAAGGDVRLPKIEEIRCPTLIFHGAKDPLIRSFHPRRLQSRIPGAALEFIEGAGHNPHISSAENFNQRVLEFLAND